MNTTPTERKTCPQHKRVHVVLATSYLVLFLLFMVGFAIDVVFPDRSIPSSFQPAGMALLFVGTLLIFWAQNTSSRSAQVRRAGESVSLEMFKKGPYRFMQSPTHFGVFLLFLSYGLIVGSLYVACTVLFGFMLAHAVFIPREQKLLEQKYGSAYIDYRQSLKTFF